MIPADRLCVVLLAAGRSRRFGAEDKLLAEIGETVLIEVSSRIWRACPAAEHIAVIGPNDNERRTRLEKSGWKIVINEQAADGIGTSIAVASRAVMEFGGDALLLALADMPLVPATHARKLVAAATPEIDAVLSWNGEIASPPTLLRRELWPQLAQLTGDDGARAVLKKARTARVALDSEHMLDVDTPSDLEKIKAKLNQGSIG